MQGTGGLSQVFAPSKRVAIQRRPSSDRAAQTASGRWRLLSFVWAVKPGAADRRVGHDSG